MPSGGFLRAAAASSAAFFFAASSADIAQWISPQKSLCVALFQVPFGAMKTRGPKWPMSSFHFAVKVKIFVSSFFIDCGGRHSPVSRQLPLGLKRCIATVTFSPSARSFFSVTLTWNPAPGVTVSGVSTLRKSSSWMAARAGSASSAKTR